MGHPATVLEGRVCVITGAARGIGRALAERLLAAGARVVLSDRDDEALGRTHKDLAQANSVAVTADVTSGASMAYLAGEAASPRRRTTTRTPLHFRINDLRTAETVVSPNCVRPLDLAQSLAADRVNG